MLGRLWRVGYFVENPTKVHLCRVPSNREDSPIPRLHTWVVLVGN